MQWLGFLANPKHIFRFIGSDLSDTAWTNMCNYIVILTKQDMWVVSEVTNDVQKIDTGCGDTKLSRNEASVKFQKQRSFEGETRRTNC